MAKPFAKVRREDLEVFLRHEGEFWDVEANPAFEEFVAARPLSVDDLLGAIESYAPDSAYVYVFCDSKFEAWDCGIEPDRAPLIDGSELKSFVVKSGRGDDFLWIAPSAEDAGNGSYVTILPSDGPVVETIEEHAPLPDEPTGPRLVSLAIENFKGVGQRVEIELRPITLLFGPNSAGKSTVLHALHYLKEILERQNADADTTAGGGSLLDFGGFANIVHQHDRDQTVSLRVDIQDSRLWVALDQEERMASVNEHLQIESVLNSYATSFCAVNDASVELGISWSRRLDRPMISTYRLFLENPHSTGWPPTKAKNELFAEIEFNAHAPRVLLSKLVTDHPAMIPISDWDCRGEQDRDDTGRLDMFYRDPNESCLAACMRDVVKFYQRIQGPPALADASPFEQILLQSQPSALPLGEGPIEIALRDWSDIRASLGPKDAEEAWKLFRLASDVAHELSRILTLPLESLRGCLRTFRYLGPLRKIPPRSFRTPRVRDGSRWADGQAAWDELASGDEQLIESVNHWLARDDRLNTGYRIAYRRFKEITLERVQTLEYLLGELPETLAGVTERVRTSVIGELRDAPSVNRLMLEDIAREIDVEPHDVGVGIAQLVPVVVAALSGRGVLNVIEQPELHVHPRLQAELGDLFIEACRTRDQRFIIETHSEHLILRLLRRIRETGKGAAYRGMAITPDDVAVYYVAAEGTQTTVRKIDIDTRGEFVQPWPDDFFEIDFHERFA